LVMRPRTTPRPRSPWSDGLSKMWNRESGERGFREVVGGAGSGRSWPGSTPAAVEETEEGEGALGLSKIGSRWLGSTPTARVSDSVDKVRARAMRTSRGWGKFQNPPARRNFGRWMDFMWTAEICFGGMVHGLSGSYFWLGENKCPQIKIWNRPKLPSYGHSYDIVCSNDLILCKNVRPGMTNNFTEGSFHFLCMKKSFFIFSLPQIDVFMKELPKFNLIFEPN
jgi:hypothetical protein